eukprot:TRINITY_DN16499_c0_g1_i1.p1 TRINITY_DN16499_c0_g1~~TRINITY_DN16499_c0_g1_i1.p1  ORF type:complete len:312 (+),score=35.12 TRINITY_DN16499_c0_g1_i1:138-938(+)
MIFAQEFCDRTFFIAAILAMRHNHLVVYGGAVSALIVMTVVSTMIGYTIPRLLPTKVTYWACVALLLYFGVRMLYDTRQMYLKGEGTGVSEELKEVEQELAAKGLTEGSEIEEDGDEDSRSTERSESEDDSDEDSCDANKGGIGTQIKEGTAAELGLDGAVRAQNVRETPEKMTKLHILFQAFTLTFLAEWGDRSQITTIALASAQNPYAVALGAGIAHTICTGGAVIGGKLLANQCTERQVSLIGGVMFLIFAVYSIFTGFSQQD